MSARFEIVRTDAPQPWHARFVSNDEGVWVTEKYTRMVGAERAVLSIVHGLGFTRGIELKWNVRRVEKVFVYPSEEVIPDMPVVKYLDERGQSDG